MITHIASCRATIASIAFLFGAPIAWVQDSSPWKTELHAAARLIAGATHKADDGSWLRAGVEIRLDPGWHTYWRYPGDTGVPPTFDFAGLDNVKSVTVFWPAPKRFPDGAGGQFIGYTDDVVFPLRIVTADAAKPSLLHLKLGYAFCRDVCYPAEADLDLRLSGSGSAEEPALVAAEARVPRRVFVGKGAGLSIRSVHCENGDGRKRVVVEVAAPERYPVDLFAEGPTAGWALPLPEPSNSQPGSDSELRRFTFDLDRLPTGAKIEGSTLTLTAVSPHDAVEATATLN
jgi:DsbC/DsbD-like thiol-disulfide interchange protein